MDVPSFLVIRTLPQMINKIIILLLLWLWIINPTIRIILGIYLLNDERYYPRAIKHPSRNDPILEGCGTHAHPHETMQTN